MAKCKISTLLSHIGNDPKRFEGVVNFPPHRASTIVFDSYKEFENYEKAPFTYGREGTPSSVAFEKAIAELEGAFGTVSSCSGLSAIIIALLSFSKSGDHILMMDNIYGYNRKFCENILSKYGVEIEFYSPMIGAKIKELFRENTSILFMEAPGSLTFDICDIGALVKAAKSSKIITIMDNSWSTSFLFKPLEHGIDVSMMSCTKYISGHSDAMLGTVSGTKKTYPILKNTALHLGYCPGSEELYLGLRGLRTLNIRMKEHEKQALEMALWLKKQKLVKTVLHPALISCRGHKNWKKYIKRSSGTFGIILNETSNKKIGKMVDSFKVFKLGASWGGYESLCFPVQPFRSKDNINPKDGFYMRLHIGFEDIEDLKDDLKRGFKYLG